MRPRRAETGYGKKNKTHTEYDGERRPSNSDICQRIQRNEQNPVE